MSIQKVLNVICKDVFCHKSKTFKTLLLIGLSVMGLLLSKHIMQDQIEIKSIYYYKKMATMILLLLIQIKKV